MLHDVPHIGQVVLDALANVEPFEYSMTKMSRFPHDEMIISSNVETLAKGPSLPNASALPASFVLAPVKLVLRVKNRLHALNYSDVPTGIEANSTFGSVKRP